MAKRKRSSLAVASPTVDEPPAVVQPKARRTAVPLPSNTTKLPRRQSGRGGATTSTDPNVNPDIVDGVMAMRASPDGHEQPTGAAAALGSNGTGVSNGTVPAAASSKRKNKTAPVKVEHEDNTITPINGVKQNVTDPATTAGWPGDPGAVDDLDAENEDEGEVKEALSRPPPVNSEYLPLPWKGRLGYVRSALPSCMPS